MTEVLEAVIPSSSNTSSVQAQREIPAAGPSTNSTLNHPAGTQSALTEQSQSVYRPTVSPSALSQDGLYATSGASKPSAHAAAAFTSVAEAVATAPGLQSGSNRPVTGSGPDRSKALRYPDPIELNIITVFEARDLFQQ